MFRGSRPMLRTCMVSRQNLPWARIAEVPAPSVRGPQPNRITRNSNFPSRTGWYRVRPARGRRPRDRRAADRVRAVLPVRPAAVAPVVTVVERGKHAEHDDGKGHQHTPEPRLPRHLPPDRRRRAPARPPRRLLPGRPARRPRRTLRPGRPARLGPGRPARRPSRLLPGRPPRFLTERPAGWAGRFLPGSPACRPCHLLPGRPADWSCRRWPGRPALLGPGGLPTGALVPRPPGWWQGRRRLRCLRQLRPRGRWLLATRAGVVEPAAAGSAAGRPLGRRAAGSVRTGSLTQVRCRTLVTSERTVSGSDGSSSSSASRSRALGRLAGPWPW